jgi:hypothetical protein
VRRAGCALFALTLAGCGFSEVHAPVDLLGAPDLAGATVDLAGADLAVGSSGGHARVFVSSTLTNGNLMGGLLGADLFCNKAASQLGGTWRAWMSDSRTDAIDRVLGDGPWYRTDGALAFDNRAALAAWPDVPLSFDETGHAADTSYDGVWTATGVGGIGFTDTSLGAGNCSEWTDNESSHYGRLGDMIMKDDAWTNEENADCSTQARVYCFESP